MDNLIEIHIIPRRKPLNGSEPELASRNPITSTRSGAKFLGKIKSEEEGGAQEIAPIQNSQADGDREKTGRAE